MNAFFIRQVFRFISILSRASGEDVFSWFERRGFYVMPKHYYAPIPPREDLTDTFFNSQSELVGIALDPEEPLSFAQTLLSSFGNEFNQFPLHQTSDPSQYYVLNGTFMAGDGNIYYSLVRHLKSKRIIEIGAGQSTLLAKEAIQQNEAHDGRRAQLTIIEPYPDAIVKGRTLRQKAEINLVEKRVQDVPLSLFGELSNNDILFVDSSHVLRAGGDVQYIFCEILPRLQDGVYVHIHDISLPKQYPRLYFERSRYFWNEQYLLQAMLSYNSRYKIIWPGNYIAVHRPALLTELFPQYEEMLRKYPSAEPSSFWMRVKKSSSLFL